MQHDLSAHVSSSGLSRLRSLHKAGDTKALHDELKALGLSKMGERARAIGALAREEEAACRPALRLLCQCLILQPLPPPAAARCLRLPHRIFHARHIWRRNACEPGHAARCSGFVALLRWWQDVLALVQTPVSRHSSTSSRAAQSA